MKRVSLRGIFLMMTFPVVLDSVVEEEEEEGDGKIVSGAEDNRGLTIRAFEPGRAWS
ncbi:MAG: hypothetical protein R6W71_00885 [Bacteroidales bacterium]